MRASFTPQEVHQDWPGTVHGRIITALLYKQGTITMMRGMEAKFGSPASVGKKLLADGGRRRDKDANYPSTAN